MQLIVNLILLKLVLITTCACHHHPVAHYRSSRLTQPSLNPSFHPSKWRRHSLCFCLSGQSAGWIKEEGRKSVKSLQFPWKQTAGAAATAAAVAAVAIARGLAFGSCCDSAFEFSDAVN